MKSYILTQTHQGLQKDTVLYPVPNHANRYATKEELAKPDGPVNLWFESYLVGNPDVFKEVSE